MEKGAFIAAGIILLLTGMISAYSYNPASIGDFFNTLGGENLGLIIIFLVSFALLFTILGRTGFFKDNPSASTVIALMLSIGITYGVYKQGIDFNIDSIFLNLGMSEMVLDLLVFFGTLIVLLFFFIKLKTNALLVIGGLMIAFYIIFGLSFEVALAGAGLILIWILYKLVSFRWSRTYFAANSTWNKPLFGGSFGGSPRGVPGQKKSPWFWIIFITILVVILLLVFL